MPSRNRLHLFLALITIAGARLPAIAPAAPPLDASSLFQADHLVDVRVEMHPQDWERLCRQSRNFVNALGRGAPISPFTYFKANVTIDGVRIEGVGVRKKGFLGSLDEFRPSLKIKFSEYTKQSPVAGLDRMTLNNNKQDPSQASQVMSYRFFNRVGIAAPRCNLARVTVNGKSLGVYSHVESVKKPFLKQRFGSSKGQLFEGTVADFHPGKTAKFQAKNAKPDDAILKKITEIVAAPKIDLGELDKHLNLKSFIRFWAAESIIGFWDGYNNNQNNYFVYQKPADSRLYFIPWGTDSAFTDTMPLPPYRVLTKSVHSQSVLANLLYRLPRVEAMYRETFQDLLNNHWNEKQLLADLEQIRTLAKDHVIVRQGSLDRAHASMQAFIKGRRTVLQAEMKNWPLKLTKGPRQGVYFKQIGVAKATFSGKWHTRSPSRPWQVGQSQVELTVAGKPIKFKQIGAYSEFGKFAPPGEKPPTVVLVGLRQSNGQRLTLAFGPSRATFRPGAKPTPIQGVMIEGLFGFLNPRAMKWLSGTATFEKAAIGKDEPVKGRFEVKVLQMVGGE